MSGMGQRTVDEEVAFRLSRQEVFGGSDAPAVFGFSSYRDALDVYHEKTRPVRREEVERDLEQQGIHIFRGNRNEGDAVRLYLEEHGYEGRRESRQYAAGEGGVLAVHVDGTVFEDPGRPDWKRGTGVIEAKSPYVATFARLVSEGIGPAYIIQLQFNLAVTDRPWGALIFFCDHHEAGPIVSVERPADESLCALLRERAEEFMRRHVAERIPPDPEEWSLAEDSEVNEALLERGGDYVLVEDESFLRSIGRPLVDRYRISKDAEAAYRELQPEAQRWIEERLESDAALLPGGDKLRIVRRSGSTRLDERQLRASRPIDRDALVRYLREHGAAGAGDPDAIADRLELDFGRYEKVGRASSHLRIYPASS